MESSSSSTGDNRVGISAVMPQRGPPDQSGHSSIENSSRVTPDVPYRPRQDSNVARTAGDLVLPVLPDGPGAVLESGLNHYLAQGRQNPRGAGIAFAQELRGDAQTKIIEAARLLCVLAVEARLNEDTQLTIAAATAMFELIRRSPDYGGTVEAWFATRTGNAEKAFVPALESDSKAHIDVARDIVDRNRDQAGYIVGEWFNAMLWSAEIEDAEAYDAYASLLIAAFIPEKESNPKDSLQLKDLIQAHSGPLLSDTKARRLLAQFVTRGAEDFSINIGNAEIDSNANKADVSKSSWEAKPAGVRIFNNSWREGLIGKGLGQLLASAIVTPATNGLFSLGGWYGAGSVLLSSIGSFAIHRLCNRRLEQRTATEAHQPGLLRFMRVASGAAPFIAPAIWAVTLGVSYAIGQPGSAATAAFVARYASETLLTGQLSTVIRQLLQSGTQGDFCSGQELTGQNGRRLKEHQKIQVNMWRDFIYTATSAITYLAGAGAAYLFNAWLDEATGGALTALGINFSTWVGTTINETLDGAIPEWAKLVSWKRWGGEHADGRGFVLNYKKQEGLSDSVPKTAEHFYDNASMRTITGVAGGALPAMLVKAIHDAGVHPLAVCFINGLAGALNGLLTGPRARWLLSLMKPTDENPSGLATEMGVNIRKNIIYGKKRLMGENLTEHDTLSWKYSSEMKPESGYTKMKKATDQHVDRKLLLEEFVRAAEDEDELSKLLEGRRENARQTNQTVAGAVLDPDTIEVKVSDVREDEDDEDEDYKPGVPRGGTYSSSSSD